MEIHKTALIDKSVILGKNIVIGPFTQIMGQVKISDNVKRTFISQFKAKDQFIFV